MVKTVQVLVKLPLGLLQKVDEIVLEEGYTSRQEFIRELIRKRVRAGPEVEMVEEITRRRKVRVSGRRVTVTPPRSSLQRCVLRSGEVSPCEGARLPPPEP